MSDFQPQGQPGLTQKLQQVVKDLQEIDKLRPSVADILVPMEVFDYIDGGRNPQLYTKDCMEKAHSKNEDIKGKIDAYRMFKARLLLELGRFPAIFRGGDLVKTPQRLELTFSNTGRVCSGVKCQSSGGTNPRTGGEAEQRNNK